LYRSGQDAFNAEDLSVIEAACNSLGASITAAGEPKSSGAAAGGR